jgi:hypothetical protein
MRYRKKPIIIDAVQWFKMGDHPAVIKVGGGFDGDGQVHGKQGWVSVFAGDWIIAEQDGGGFYPCEPDTFAATYEPVSD